MLSVKEIMTRDVIIVSPETDIAHAARLLLEKRFPIPTLFTLLDGFIPLTSMKHLEREVKKITATTVADAMSANPVTVRPEASIEEVGTIMVDKNFHTLPVVDKGKLVGIVGKEDVLKTLVSGSQAR